MKLRKIIEITFTYSGSKAVRTGLYEPTDTVMLKYWRNSDMFISERVVYRLANRPLWNTTFDGAPF